ncbi:hypothetical protein [Kaistia granuli]|uniref:hypothetical protein n=1 Tax=Kaistia granuli TaxID=363259 RepID=UPI0003632512|nr:hypothetical protein [Kaistia granuli]
MFAATGMVSTGDVRAQQAIVGPEDAVVTGFSGTADGPAPAGADPLDYLVIPPDGPSARVVDLSRLGPQGTISDAPKSFSVTAGQVGQVFGVALDDAPAPSLYLAATSAYGLSIGLADAPNGPVKRLLHGLAGATFLPNQFGAADPRGGPASIWRVDGTTGQVALFANIGEEGGNGAASLGGLAFDADSQQIFVADRATGRIHRLGLDGTDRGNYDHGVDGRAANGLPEVPFAPVGVDIASQTFDTEQPATWGFADPERLVFALAVRNGRLFYSVAAGPEIWSVGINRDGSFAGDARFETAVETLAPGIEIASIAFDNRGLLYAAERAPPTGAYDFRNVAEGGSSRVLRFRPKTRPDSEPGLWMPVPEEYAIGILPDYQNGNGGVALGRGYDANGRMQVNACAVTLWSTGELLLGAAPQADPLDGLQGNDTQLVLPANAPPTRSWFVDYDDQPGDSAFAGHMGAVATLPCVPPRRAAAPPPPRFSEPLPPPPPVIIGCPIGTFLVGDACLLPPSCPPGTRFRNGYCVAVGCPPDMIRVNGACLPPPMLCDRYETFVNGRCIPWRCPSDLVRLPNGYCGCPRDEIYVRGQCIPQRCPPDMFMTRDGRCVPPQGCRPPMLRDDRGRCVPPQNCRPPMRLDRYGRCVPPQGECRPPLVRDNSGRCVPPQGECRPPLVRDNNGRCVPPTRPCPRGQERADNGRCRPIATPCPEGQVRKGGRCVAVGEPPVRPRPETPECRRGQRLVDGVCVNAGRPQTRDCPDGTVSRGGRCVPVKVEQPDKPVRPKPVECGPDQRLRNGRCVDIRRPQTRDCPDGTISRGGRCVPVKAEQPARPVRPAPVECGPDQRLRNGRCVDAQPQRKPVPQRQTEPQRKAPDCPDGTVQRRGQCVPAQQEKGDAPQKPPIRLREQLQKLQPQPPQPPPQ